MQGKQPNQTIHNLNTLKRLVNECCVIVEASILKIKPCKGRQKACTGYSLIANKISWKCIIKSVFYNRSHINNISVRKDIQRRIGLTEYPTRTLKKSFLSEITAVS